MPLRTRGAVAGDLSSNAVAGVTVAAMSRIRRCGYCGEGTLYLGKQQQLRGAGSEGHWTCEKCLMTVKLLDPMGRLLFGVLTVAFVGLIPYMAVTDRVANESDRPWLVAGVAALALALGVLWLRDSRAQRKHPPRSGPSQ